MSTNFNEQCYSLLKQIPKGQVSTYKEIANALNCKAYQAVGNAMNKNPNPVTVPCHRVVKNSGNIGGYAMGKERKIELLKLEGVQVKLDNIVNFENILFKFDTFRKLSD